MTQQLLSSKVIINEDSPAVRPIAGVSTNVLGLVGVTEKGPVGSYKLVTSPAEYRKYYGGYTASGDVAQAIDGFFSNGGAFAYVSRVVHMTDVADTTTKTSSQAVIVIPDTTPTTTITAKGKYDGTYANGIQVVIEASTSGEATEFNLRVVRAGVTVETYVNLSNVLASPKYYPATVNDDVNGSEYIVLSDAALGTRPVNGTYTLATGADGLGSIADTDFLGAAGTTTRSGMRVLDLVQDLALLAIPGRATSTVQNGMLVYCEVTRDKAVFAILDPPASTSATGMVTYVKTTAAIMELSEFGAIYWPRVKVANPNKTIFGTAELITVAPSGYIAGVMARNDGAREGGVYDAPAGVELGRLLNVLGFETDEVLDEPKADLVAGARINPIRTMPGFTRYIDGSDTLKSTGNFPSVSERRGVNFIEQSIKLGLQFARHRNNDEALRAAVSRTCEGFLTIQMRNKAFRSLDPAKAFYVDFGESLNPPAVAFAGKLVGRIGLATQKPAKFVIVNFTQDTRGLVAAA